MTWPEVVEFALEVLGLLGLLFFFAVLANGWPGSRDD